ncbi:hypothetical protein H8B15_01405 [Hymenobacter sp. BT507]|uniref:Uncharacterized protein n=1 Tax=Hymenobacter citatus TaxID=2763506 RepID=A0ABR7MER5_9BACT|nr:protease inhibitor I42 family protein [Hymenobacter citatus]MBC6609557.1 hypothetical protein [Hymenobacter citatus]
MEMQQLTLRVQEQHAVTLPSRGASGLQLLFSTEPADIVLVVRREPTPNEREQPPITVGGTIAAYFELTGLKPGQATVRFYEKPAPGRGGPSEIPVATYLITVSQ